MGKESIESEVRAEQRAMENRGQMDAPLKERVAADHAKTATQLKAEHGKEMAALKAEEVKATAALKAEHAKTPGKTGLLAKLTGHEDPVKKAENQQLKAEIARAEEATKAEHSFENAELDARRAKENATVGAAAALGSGGLKRGGAGIHDEHVRDNKIYNHATGEHGLAALHDNGLTGDHHHGARSETGHTDHHGHHHGHGHNDGQNAGGFGGQNAGGFGQNAGGFGAQNAGYGAGAPQMVGQVVGQVPVVAQMPVAAAGLPCNSMHAASSMPASSMPASSMPASGAVPVAVIAPQHGARY